MDSKTGSWKQKIDPALIKIIKYFLQTLSQSDLPANTGWITLEDHYMKIMEAKGMQGWIKKYKNVLAMESDISKSIMKKKNEPVKEQQKHLRDSEREIFKTIEMLPEESREYYSKRFRPWFSEKDRNEVLLKMSKEEVKAYLRDMSIDIYVLGVQRMLVEEEKMKENNKPQVLQKKFNKTEMFMNLWTSLNDAISLLMFKKHIYVLIKEASNGDEIAFFNLLQIDRTVIEFDWAKKMIRKAQLTGNNIFFNKMAKAISSAPLENTRIHGQALIVLLIFWELGLYRLDNNEQIELLKEAGIRVQDDPETFRKFVNREIRPLFPRS